MLFSPLHLYNTMLLFLLIHKKFNKIKLAKTL